MKWQNYIESNPDILFGKPVIKGTRISVELILEKMGKGSTESDLLAAYPHLTSKQIQACMLFASEHLKSEVIYPIAS